MIILGINDAHDASAALMIDGIIVAAGQEERWTGLKGDYGYPKNAIDFCLSFANIKPDEVDIVTVPSQGWNPVLIKLKRNANFTVQDWITEQHKFWKYELKLEPWYGIIPGKMTINVLTGDKSFELGYPWSYWDIYKDRGFILDKYYPFDHLIDKYQDKYADSNIIKEAQKIRLKYIQDRFPKSCVNITIHEDAHTYYSYYGSHLAGEEVLALTAEGVGDYSNSTVSIFNPQSEYRKELSYSIENHIGHIYQYITLLLGMKPAQHEYKVMGLAPYADKHEIEKSYNVFKDILKVDDELRVIFKNKPKDLYFHFKDALEGHRFDGIAGALQKWTEEILCKWVTKCVEKTGIRKIVCSGGVFQNIKAGKAINELDCVDDISILPITGDASTSIGACYYQNSGGKPLTTMYLGPDPLDKIDYYSEFKFRKKLKEKYIVNHRDQAECTRRSFEENIAIILSQGKILGRCSGRMEFGHRALGNRSILTDPRNPAIVKRLNSAIKHRDWFMPFTPTVLNKFQSSINNPKKLDARFMCMAFDSTEWARKCLPAALHPADLTVRPQVLNREDNPEYWNIINEFRHITGIGALLNTSFNLHGEPIVLGAKEALKTFENSGLDGLILSNYLIMKRDN